MITREAAGTILTHAGPEIGVASTKAFTAQLAALLLLASYLGQVREKLAPDSARKLIAGIHTHPRTRWKRFCRRKRRDFTKGWHGNISGSRIFCTWAEGFIIRSRWKAR